MNKDDITSVYFPNTKQGVKDYLMALTLIATMPTGYNRKVCRKHAKNLAKSIKDNGITRVAIAINTGSFEGLRGNDNKIIEAGLKTYCGDAQHMIYALLNYVEPDEIYGTLGIQFRQYDSMSEIIPFVSSLNSCAKTWTIKEFLTAWSTHNETLKRNGEKGYNRNYTHILELHRETKYSISKLMEIHIGQRFNFSSGAFRLGNLKLNHKLGSLIFKGYDNVVGVGLCKTTTSFLAYTRFVIDNGIYKYENGKFDFDKIIEFMAIILRIVGNEKENNNERKTNKDEDKVFGNKKLKREELLTLFRFGWDTYKVNNPTSALIKTKGKDTKITKTKGKDTKISKTIIVKTKELIIN